jgi:hypothetical protein
VIAVGIGLDAGVGVAIGAAIEACHSHTPEGNLPKDIGLLATVTRWEAPRPLGRRQR